MRKNTIETFWSRVERTDSCWLWQGTINEKGYGSRFNLDGTCISPHRLSYILHKGPIAPGLCVCHSCDNRRCVNPDHLWLGTPADNNRDRYLKGRSARGTQMKQSHLTEQDIVDIRNNPASPYKLAAIYGVSANCIYDIKNRTYWQHVK